MSLEERTSSIRRLDPSRAKIIKYLAAIPGLVIIALIGLVPALPTLLIISFILCTISFACVAIVTLVTKPDQSMKKIPPKFSEISARMKQAVKMIRSTRSLQETLDPISVGILEKQSE